MAQASQSKAGRGAGKGHFGVLLVDKPLGPTSHDVVAWARWALRERSIGHCGTLDPAASGLLVLCVGEATKLVEHLSAVDKRYQARFVLGASTTTADAQGAVVEEAELPPELDDRIESAVSSLLGPIELPPPVFSAVKLQGKRAHALARAGELTSLPPRAMAVHAIELLGHGREGSRAWIDADLRVAKGTYVRSLAEELGKRVDLPGHLGGLRRLSCGPLSLEDPSAVTGLCGRELDSIPGRPPKWRIEFADGDPAEAAEQADVSSRRDQMGARLRAAMIQPWTRLPFAVSVLSEQGPHEPLLTRLLQGQRLAGDSATHQALGLDEGAGLCGVVVPSAGRMIILERELEARRIAPRRVLRFEPSLDSSH